MGRHGRFRRLETVLLSLGSCELVVPSVSSLTPDKILIRRSTSLGIPVNLPVKGKKKNFYEARKIYSKKGRLF